MTRSVSRSTSLIPRPERKLLCLCGNKWVLDVKFRNARKRFSYQCDRSRPMNGPGGYLHRHTVPNLGSFQLSTSSTACRHHVYFYMMKPSFIVFLMLSLVIIRCSADHVLNYSGTTGWLTLTTRQECCEQKDRRCSVSQCFKYTFQPLAMSSCSCFDRLPCEKSSPNSFSRCRRLIFSRINGLMLMLNGPYEACLLIQVPSTGLQQSLEHRI